MSAHAAFDIGGAPDKPGDKPFWAKCKDCSHCWIAAYWPIAVETLVRIAKHQCCPKCGGVALVAKQHDGVLDEAAP